MGIKPLSIPNTSTTRGNVVIVALNFLVSSDICCIYDALKGKYMLCLRLAISIFHDCNPSDG